MNLPATSAHVQPQRGKRRVVDLMTSPAVTVFEDTGFKEIVTILENRRISAVPVVDALGIVLGIVSEADLMLKEEPEGGATVHFASGHTRKERAKAGASLARDLMSAPAVTIEPDATVAKAARVMHDKRIKRLPVVDGENHVLGVISRRDILKVYLRDDAEIRDEILDVVVVRELWMDPSTIDVTVVDGVVRFEGDVPRRSDIPILMRMAAGVGGVVAVEEALRYHFDDRWTDAAPISRVSRS